MAKKNRNNKKNKNNREISLNDLAAMVQRGFVGMEKRIGGKIVGLDGKIISLEKKMDEKFEETWLKLDSLERRIIFLEDKITEHSKILVALQKELREVKTTIYKYQKDKETDRKKIIFLEKRVQKLEAKVFA